MTNAPPPSSRKGPSSFPFKKLDVYVVSRELVVLICSAQIADAELRDQATRACKSVLLNLAEGLPLSDCAKKRQFFRTALQSLHELVSATDGAVAIGALDPAVDAKAEQLALRIRAMLIKMTGL